MDLYKKNTLENGMRVVLVPQPNSLTATVFVLVEAGSSYEDKKINGISHFLEHLCFKGTPTRPTPAAISSELDSLGAEFNAFTSNEITGYFVKIAAQKIDKAIDVVSDMYLNPIFDKKELEKEKGVIIEEINMREDNPARKTYCLFDELLYGDQPAGRDIVGTKEIITSLCRDDIVNYRKNHYVAKSTVVVVAGKFKESEILDQIKSTFSGVSTENKKGKIKVVEEQNKPAVLVHEKKSDQTHLMLGFRAFDMYDKRRYPLELLSNILGGNMSSRLFKKIRDELGAAYYINSGAYFLTDHGYLAARAGVDNSRVKIIIQAILGEFKKIKSEKVEEKELQKAKNNMIGRILLGLETSDSLAGFYGEQELFKEKIKTPQEIVEKIKNVTAEEVLKVANNVIKESSLNLVLIGPFNNNAEFESVLKL